MAEWAADGLLAIFFFVAGLELKREFVAGDLRDPRRAALPVAAAVGGMVAPARDLRRRQRRQAGGAPVGWAMPTATDIAFALAVLGLISTHLPAALRTFLLTLAVVDDLLAITIIADLLHRVAWPRLPLLLALIPLAGFARARATPGPHLVAAAPARRCHLDPGARLRRARHRRRRPARLHRPGASAAPPAKVPGSPNTSSTAGARCPPGSPYRVFAFFAAGVSLVRRRRTRRQPRRSRHHRHRGSAWSSARPSASSARPGSSSGSPGPSWPTESPGGTCWAWRCWPASASPSPC